MATAEIEPTSVTVVNLNDADNAVRAVLNAMAGDNDGKIDMRLSAVHAGRTFWCVLRLWPHEFSRRSGTCLFLVDRVVDTGNATFTPKSGQGGHFYAFIPRDDEPDEAWKVMSLSSAPTLTVETVLPGDDSGEQPMSA